MKEVRPVVSYGAEAWTLTKKEEQALLIFERKIFRGIYGPKYENGEWKSNVYWTVHHCNSWRMKNQLDVTCYILFHLLCAQHVSGINISIFRSLRLCQFVVCWSFCCSWYLVVFVLQVEAVLQPAKRTPPNISRSKNSNTQRTENKTTDLVIHQHSRKLLKMDILMSETCWAHNKWNKISSDIKLVFHSSNQKVLIFTCMWNLSRSHVQSGSEAHKQHRTFTFTYNTIRVSTVRSFTKSEPKYNVYRHSTRKTITLVKESEVLATCPAHWTLLYIRVLTILRNLLMNHWRPPHFVALWPHFGSWPPITGIAITITEQATLGRTRLDEWSARTDTSTWQYITLTKDRHPRPRRKSNKQSQQASSRRLTP